MSDHESAAQMDTGWVSNKAKHEEALRLLEIAKATIDAQPPRGPDDVRLSMAIDAYEPTPQEETVTPVSDVDELIGLVNRFGTPPPQEENRE